MTPENAAQIRAYIEQHRATYPRADITAQLVAAGYSPTAVAAAWHATDAPPAPPREHPRIFLASPIFWLALLAVIVGTDLIPAIVWLFPPISWTDSVRNIMGPVGITILILTQVAALGIGLWQVRSNRPLGLGLFIGLLLSDLIIPVVFICVTAILVLGSAKDF